MIMQPVQAKAGDNVTVSVKQQRKEVGQKKVALTAK
jgi:hypothetical protein